MFTYNIDPSRIRGLVHFINNSEGQINTTKLVIFVSYNMIYYLVIS